MLFLIRPTLPFQPQNPPAHIFFEMIQIMHSFAQLR
ncbi:hypothetical protein C8J30_101575 [Rhodobacter viridis]|uniref:Uncharacterized protein n=1 Tax=Rhodobacter viridis TaxID=1054202 RepID=A0A318U3L3_9RHOB|nr:hypothetical protein C8J30_101575 [Rhodobacter viridis]